MPDKSVMGVIEDPGLTALAQALSGRQMLPLIAGAVDIQSDIAGGLTYSSDVLRHWPGKRCTIRYNLTYPGDHGKRTHPVAVIGKLYRRHRKAARIYRRMKALRGEVFNDCGPLRIPTPLSLIPEMGLVFQEYVEAPDLRQILSSDDGDSRPLSLAAQWLATLHTAPPLAGLDVKSQTHEIGNMDRWCDIVVPFIPITEARRLRQTQDALHKLADDIPPCKPVMIHRDFYPAQILWDGVRVWVLDFAQLSIGDPVRDVGYFLAQLEDLSYRTTGQRYYFARSADLFIKAYLKRNPVDLQFRLPFYRAYTFLNLAANQIIRKPKEWRRFSRLLSSLACREVDKSVLTASRPA